jgi:hypothetical protein
MGLQQNVAWQRAFNKILTGNGPSTTLCLATGLQQNFAWQRASTKLCLAKGLQQNIAWQWDFKKALPGNEPSTKRCLETGLQQNLPDNGSSTTTPNKQMLTRSSCKVLLTCKESCILHTRDTPFRPILRVSCMLDSNINIVIIPGNIGKIKKSMKS